MRRDDSSILQFRERIPRDVLDRVRGRTLDIPVADASIRVRVTPTAEAIKVSLRTRNPSEAKARHAVVRTYLANVYRIGARPSNLQRHGDHDGFKQGRRQINES